MSWDFETDPEYRKVLDWADEFVREELEPLDLAFPHLQFVPLDDKRRKVIDPLKEEVRRKGFWAARSGLRSCSAVRRPTPATLRSSPTTAPKRRKKNICVRCSTVSCSPAI